MNQQNFLLEGSATSKMPIYHINKKQLESLFERMNKKGRFLEEIKNYLDKTIVLQHSNNIMPTGIYVADEADDLPVSTYLLYKGTSDDNRPIYGNVFFYYGPKTYANLPQHFKLLDAEANNLSV